MPKLYKIVRYYRKVGKKNKIITINLTLEEAEKHCNDPKSKGNGWFDGFTEQRSFN